MDPDETLARIRTHLPDALEYQVRAALRAVLTLIQEDLLTNETALEEIEGALTR